MKEMDLHNDDELESQNLSGKKSDDRKPSGDDPISDKLLGVYYLMRKDSMKGLLYGLCAAPFLLIFLFWLLISDSTSNIIAFSALVVSIVFMGISVWMLCWILDKDQGTRAMQDISDPIKEGSEGFFITQYGTIF
jgi:hypothetical protein